MYDYPIVVKVHSCSGIDYFPIFYIKPGSMDAEEMRRRTKSFAINVAKFTGKIPDTQVNRIYKGQIIRSSSSVGANYRASRRAKSKPDFINKLKIVEEELDESLFFLELLVEFNKAFETEINDLYKEEKHF